MAGLSLVSNRLDMIGVVVPILARSLFADCAAERMIRATAAGGWESR